MKSLPIVVLLFALTVGSIDAQNMAQQPQTPRDGGWLVQDFEDNDMHGWIFQNSTGSTVGGQIATGFNHTPEGSRSYYLNGSSGSQSDCYLISPELTNTENGVNVNFWSTNYNPQGNTTSLRVGYSTTTINYSAFTWNEPHEVSNVWQEYVEDLPANVKYIAIGKPIGSTYIFVDDIVFSDAACPAPAITEATQTSQSITLSWTGNSNSYELWYAPFYIDDFNGDLDDWTTLPATNSWEWNPHIDYSHSGAGSALSDVNVSQHDNYLVSPLITFGGSMTFYVHGFEIIVDPAKKDHPRASAQYDFKVMVSTAENPTVYEQIGGVVTASDQTWQKITVDLSAYSGTGHVAICHIYNPEEPYGGEPEEHQYKLALDDINVTCPWKQPIEVAATNYTIENLDPDTYYTIKVKNDCDKWSNVVNVRTLPESWSGPYEFINNGDWNIASNWKYGAMPTEDGDVTIKAAARIPAGYVAKVGTITIAANSKLTIADGGQLKHNNTGVKARMEKNITGYNTGDNNHYQLIAFPSASNFNIGDDNTHGLLNHYVSYTQYNENELCDFYYFDQSQELEWVNYFITPTEQVPDPAPGFTKIYKGKGYLYASKNDRLIVFGYVDNQYTPSLMPSNEDVQISLAYTAGTDFAGYNLIGNPFACNAYFTDNRPFYRMVETSEGSKIMLATNNVIAPMEGIFVQATGTNQHAVFTSNEPRNNGDGMMDFTVRKANTRTNTRIDRTRIMFGEGSNMMHLDLMSDPNRLYFPIDSKAMSVVYAQPVGELPLNFEVATEGTFVLGFECRNEDLAYCHLIDNLTGSDIDLLQQPEYTFESRRTDYASRFRVVFATGSSVDGDSFAFINSMGNLTIFGIEGKATLQVIDITGRMISSETFNGSYEKKLNVAPGVYVLRLINGENVKTQKIIVK